MFLNIWESNPGFQSLMKAQYTRKRSEMLYWLSMPVDKSLVVDIDLGCYSPALYRCISSSKNVGK